MQFYQHNIPAWMDGTEGLDDGPYRAYHVIVQLIYQNDGPITNHESGIAGRCNQHPLAFRKHFKKLLDLGKLTLTPDGKIANKRADSEIAKVSSRRRSTKATPPRPRGGVKGVGRGSEGGDAAKPLKNNDPPPTDGTLYNIDSRDTNVSLPQVDLLGPLPVKQEAPDAPVFRRGREVLGKSAGGVVRNLIEHHNGVLPLALADLERASTCDRPREYVGRILAGPRKGSSSGNGLARAAVEALKAIGMNGEDHHDGATLDLTATVPAGARSDLLALPSRAHQRRQG